MNRREFLATTVLSGLSISNVLAETDKRPNILFIMTDQQSATMLSCTGNPWVKTPNLDSLAAEGIRFERSYACNPVCVPNRFSLQTGLMPSAIGMGKNEDKCHVPEDMCQNSLGNLFQRAGYDTAYAGKVHLPQSTNNVNMNALDKMGYRNLGRDAREDLVESCTAFFQTKRDNPFFLFASFINPHDICYMALNEYRALQGQKPIVNIDSKTCDAVLARALAAADLDAFVEQECPPLPDNHLPPRGEPECITTQYLNARPFRAYARNEWSDAAWRLHRWLYARLTEMVDEKIGRLLDVLHEAGLDDNTLIVFTSDHGDMDAAHKMEHKSVLYDEAVRIPFIMRYKGHIPEGIVDETHLTSNGLDLMPTLCDYAGIPVPGKRSGQSLRPVAEGKTPGPWRDCVVTESQNGRMVRTASHKYCVYDSGKNREFLVDLIADPGEMKNLAEDETYKAVLVTHRQLLRSWVEESNDNIAKNYIM